MKPRRLYRVAPTLLAIGMQWGFSQTATSTLHLFPHVAAGDSGPTNFRTHYYIINPSSQAANIQIDFLAWNSQNSKNSVFNNHRLSAGGC